MIAFLHWVYVAGVVVLLFGAAIFVHEFGHFLVARWRGLKVEGFSIGFGPKLFGWRRGGIDYAVRWIPAGGFVALPQMVTSTALEGKGQDAEPLPPASPGSKILVALAGPAMNGVFACFIATVIYFLGLPVLVNPAIIGGVEADSAEAKLGIRSGDRIVAVNGKTVSSWEDAQTTVMMARTNVLPVTLEREGARKTYLLTAKVNEFIGLKLLNLEPRERPVIHRVLAGTAAAEGGLMPGDEIESLAGVPVVGEQQLQDLIRKRPLQPTAICVMRGPKAVTLTVTPKLDPSTKAGLLGIEFGPSQTSVYQVQRPGPPPWELVTSICGQTFDLLGALMHPRQTGVHLSDLSGPPGILAMLATEVRADFRLALRFMVLLNISLAILNLLPIPVLDGGHILMAVIEKIRGRPLSGRVQEYATTAFAAVLISFMLYVSFNDVVRRLPLFRIMFDQQVQIEPAGGAQKR
ncbi:MAG: RIP metalloprotease RseP [Limisphaerales bacterium]